MPDGTDAVTTAIAVQAALAKLAQRAVLVLPALRPDGTVSVVLDPPAGVSSVDIPQDLLREGRFGGPVPAPAALPARWPVIAQAALCLLAPVLLAAAAVVVMVRAVRRRRAGVRAGQSALRAT